MLTRYWSWPKPAVGEAARSKHRGAQDTEAVTRADSSAVGTEALEVGPANGSIKSGSGSQDLGCAEEAVLKTGSLIWLKLWLGEAIRRGLAMFLWMR